MKQIVGAAYTPFHGVPVSIAGWMGKLGRVQLGHVVGTGGRSVRCKSLTNDCDDRFNLIVPSKGSSVMVDQCGRQHEIRAGNVALVRMDEPATLDFSRFQDSRLLFVSKKEILERVPSFCDNTAHKVLNSGPIASLIQVYLSGVDVLSSQNEPALDNLIASHLIDLLVFGLRDSSDNREAAGSGGVRSIRFAAVQRYIDENFRDPGVTIQQCANKLGLSRSYIQLILEEAGGNFTQSLQQARVAAACRLLSQPEYKRMSIADIAFSCGFSDLSTFNRTFRRLVDQTPSRFRGGARKSEP